MAKTKKKSNAKKPAVEKASPDRVERDRYKERLPCKIELDLVHAKGAELATTIAERAIFLERVKAENAKRRERRAFFDERIEELGNSINMKAEDKPVECVEYLVTKGKKKVIEVERTDTGEIIQTREAEADDLQEELPAFPGHGPGEGPKAHKSPLTPSEESAIEREAGAFGEPDMPE